MDVWERVLGFADAQAVLTAHDRGVFEVLGAEPAAAAVVAERVRLPVCSCDRLLRLLVALELLERLPDGRYANTPEARAQLVSTSDTYMGRFLPYLRDVLYPAWGQLDAHQQCRPSAARLACRPAPSRLLAQELRHLLREKRLELGDSSGKPRLDRHIRHHEEKRRTHGQKKVERELRGRSGQSSSSVSVRIRRASSLQASAERK
ncbi:MAG: hypothetical protein LC791_06985 [Acidobacteria bacterium]|nr:hypothetical protein [Acidobacteriota bacterium]